MAINNGIIPLSVVLNCGKFLSFLQNIVIVNY